MNLTAPARLRQMFAPGLYVVATPIGNLGDMTFRAVDTLAQADLILAEDTRVTGKLLRHYGIGTRAISYNEHNAEARFEEILARLQRGECIALVSDAGTPLISDPGYRLVRELAAAGIAVFAVPGASSVTAALSISGLPTERFFFAGFLTAKSTARKKEIEVLKNIPATLVFLESPHRIGDMLADLAELLGIRKAAVARELTKLHEEVVRGTLPQLAERYREKEVKGEIVLLVAPPDADERKEIPLTALLEDALVRLSLKDAVAEITRTTGLPRSEVYAKALELKK